MQDAQLISQAGLVESLASDGLVSVSTGAGQPQKNMELAKFADSLGSSVPLQQNAEQVGITGLYARTSDGKMVELTKESVASVMVGLMGFDKFYARKIAGTSKDDMVAIAQDVHHNLPDECSFSVIHNYSGERTVRGYVYGGKLYGTFVIDRYQGNSYIVDLVNGEFKFRTEINFGYNTLAELSSGVAEQMSYGAIPNLNIDTINTFMWARVQGSTATSATGLPFGSEWFVLINFHINEDNTIQFAFAQNAAIFKSRTKWDGTFREWQTI